MRYITFILLALFWAGLLLIFKRKPWGLKERALHFLGRTEAYAKESSLYDELNKLRFRRKKNVMLGELSESMAYINNLVVLGRAGSLSAELLLTELADFCPKLGPVYLDMVHSLHTNDREKAADALYKAIGDSYARDIGEFLAGWDDIPPGDMKNTINIYTDALRSERDSRARKRDEIVSDLIYFPAVVNSMLVLLNFIYVAFFIEQKEALTSLFL